VQAKLGKKQDPVSKIIRVKRTGSMAQVVECLSSKLKALSSNAISHPTPCQKKKIHHQVTARNQAVPDIFTSIVSPLYKHPIDPKPGPLSVFHKKRKRSLRDIDLLILQGHTSSEWQNQNLKLLPFLPLHPQCFSP
jgi:hypothetical protein